MLRERCQPRASPVDVASRWITVAAVVFAVLVATGILRQCTGDVVERATIGRFYDVPTPLPAHPPGTLIRTRRLLVAGLHELVGAGYVVEATDSSGMGPPARRAIPSAPLNVATSSTPHAPRVICSARAPARDLLLWRHSQGGQAALFAAQEAPHAPGLRLQGVAVAAPAAQLGPLLEDHRNDVAGVTIGS